MPESPSELRDTMGRILDRIAGMSDRIRGYFQQAKIDLAEVFSFLINNLNASPRCLHAHD